MVRCPIRPTAGPQAFTDGLRNRSPRTRKPVTPSGVTGFDLRKCVAGVVWQVLGSNQRRLSRRFYSPLAPPELPRADQRVRASRRVSGLSPSAMRPCATGSGGRCSARTGTDGGGWERYADRPQERHTDRPAPRLIADLPCESHGHGRPASILRTSVIRATACGKLWPAKPPPCSTGLTRAQLGLRSRRLVLGLSLFSGRARFGSTTIYTLCIMNACR